MIKLTTDLRETAIAIAQDAGRAIMQVYADGFDVQIKDDGSPCHQCRPGANQVIEQGLQQLTPTCQSCPKNRHRWPGSSAATGARTGWSIRSTAPVNSSSATAFSVNIALIYQGAPAFGVVLAPVTGIVWHAMRGELAYRRQGSARHRAAHPHAGHRTAAGCCQPLAPLTGNRGSACRDGPHRDHRAGLVAEVLPDRRRWPGCLSAAGPDLRMGYRRRPVLHAAGARCYVGRDRRVVRYNRRETLLNGDLLPW